MEQARVVRRLAAIVAMDVVGYSRLTGLDEEGTLARLKMLRHDVIDPPIAEAQGRIVKTTGDGLLIEFPSTVDAVRPRLINGRVEDHASDAADEVAVADRGAAEVV